MNKIDIGIAEQDRINVAEGLKKLLADTYTLYLQTHNFHWNVTGPQFRELHLMFEEHYTEMAQAVDVIAERIRTLGMAAPGTYKSLAGLSSIEEVEGVPAAEKMVELLTMGHEHVVRTARQVLKTRTGRCGRVHGVAGIGSHAHPRKNCLDAARHFALSFSLVRQARPA